MATKTSHLLRPLVVRPFIALVALVAAMAALLIAYGASPAQAAGVCSTTAGTTTCTYASTGLDDTFVVPDGVSTIHVVATGAPGAVGGLTAGNGDPAGSGAQVSGDLAVTLGQKLFVNVGGAPTSGSCGFGVACNGGFNGGGTSMFGGGGGASDVRTVSRDQPNSLESRLIVAGGGGGSGANQSCPGGAGGDAGSAGGDGASSCSNTAGGTGGGAGGQNAGGAGGIPLGGNGSLGQGGNGGGLYGLTGGGGGYYGGGDVGRGLRYNSGAGGGGGGSNLVPQGGNATVPTSSTPSVTITYTEPDATPPILSVSHKSDANGWNNTSPVTINVSASDSGSGLKADPACTDGATDLTLTAGSTSGTWTASVSGNGTHNISCSVSDKAGYSTTAKDTVNIDTTAPSVGCIVSPSTLRTSANNHKLLDIKAKVSVTDGGSGSGGFTLVSVTSNQADSGLARDDVANDIQGWSTGTPDISGQLRAERYGGARVYTLTYHGKDLAGNTKTCQAMVTVPKGG